ncbi:MAG: cupin domain-containing protein [Ignavibacteriae bacterium]|nr:cupin domain-containing protein [Ignavibacteriota bacterium]
MKKALIGKAIKNSMIILDEDYKFEMANSDGKGLPLISHDGFGADLIKFDEGKAVEKHVHPGAHILFVFKGTGTLGYYDQEHNLEPGLIYLIPSNVPHSIHATSELVLLAVGNDHRPVWSDERMELV